VLTVLTGYLKIIISFISKKNLLSSVSIHFMNEKKLISTEQVQQEKTSVCWQDRQMWRRVEGDEESRINDVQENP